MIIYKWLKKIRRNFLGYEALIKIFILRDNIISNLNEYKNKYPKISFAPVLKSNAYGHGLIEVAEIVSKEDIPFIVVDSLPEAIILRKNGIKTPILIIGYTHPLNINNLKEKKIAFTITSLEQLEQISKNVQKKLDIHLKIDTGMHRQGILVNQIESAIQIINSNSNLVLVGLCSHFSDADSEDKNYTLKQIEVWNNVVQIIKEKFGDLKFYHISATSGVNYTDEAICNVARIGLGLYGINSSTSSNLNLKPALRVESIIASIKMIKEGECVGYNATYCSENNSIVATVPAGYFEGVDRRLSNIGFFKIKDKFCPIIGRVNMNITSIDISSISDIKVCDTAIIISDKREDKNSVENIAKATKTIPWEILIHIPQHLKRVVIDK